MNEEDKLPFTAHLEELRQRLIKSFAAVGIGFVVCYFFKEKLFELLALPLIRAMKSGEHLIYTSLPEAFFVYLKTAFLGALLLASPVILYQFWMFVAPGLYDRERKLAMPILLMSTFIFVGGALFGYFIIFPYGFQFLLNFGGDTVRPMPRMKEYVGFAAKLLLAFGLVFEMPLVITFLARLGILNSEVLKRYRKYAILIFFVVAAVLTPPDVITQTMMAVPMMLLYELSIIGARVFGRKKPVYAQEDETA